MATITLRLDDEVRDELVALADARGETLSDVIRAALDSVLDRDRGTDYQQTPPSLTPVQRQILALQHRILGYLVPKDGDGEDGDPQYQLDRVHALEAGWVNEYDREFVAIQPELSRQDCRLVMDILDMFRFLQSSVARLSQDEVAALGERAEYALTFRGLDENDVHESRLLDYARHLIEQGLWKMLADAFDDAHDRGNSHGPQLAIYQRMLAVFTPIWRQILEDPEQFFEQDTYLLSPEQIRQVLDARIHPSRR